MGTVSARMTVQVQRHFLQATCKLGFTMLDVRRLRLLRELAARRTVTAVAEALSYTPSAVSQQLAALERDAGVRLIERVGRGVQLTEAGRRLVAHADAVIARLEAAEADLASEARRRSRAACGSRPSRPPRTRS